MSDCLISVIVPVYNVQDYLDKCVYSILNQSLRHYELLLIDDGSTDSSGVICDRLALLDERIKVFHKENGGLSDARNYGLKKASGDFVAFIDSDDSVHKDYLQNLYKGMIIYSSDISIVGMAPITSYDEIDTVSSDGEFILMNAEEAVRNMLCRKYFGVSANSKMYRKKLFDHCAFPVGELYEDLQTIPYLMEKCDKIVVMTGIMYYWLQRNDSIMHKQLSEKDFELFDAMDILVNHYSKRGRELRDAAICRFYTDSFATIINRTIRNDYLKNHRVIKRRLNKYLSSVKSNLYLSVKKKVQIIVYYLFPSLYKFLYLLR